jgi:hypothetical protein
MLSSSALGVVQSAAQRAVENRSDKVRHKRLEMRAIQTNPQAKSRRFG